MSETVKKKKKLSKLYKWFRFMRRIYRFVVFPIYPYKRYGHKERYNDRAYIMVGNHKSVMDVFPIAMATDQPVHYIAKSELFEKGISKWFTKKCECIPVSRDGTDVRAMMHAIKILKQGGIIGIFPEGKRNKTEAKFLPFKSGAATLAIKTQTPIIPVVQVRKIKAFKTAHVYYGEPLEFTEFYDKKLTPEDIERADKILYDRMSEIYDVLENILNAKKRKRK